MLSRLRPNTASDAIVAKSLVAQAMGDNEVFSSRVIQVGTKAKEANAQYKYCNNCVTTTKYTCLNFLPVNLFEQFRRLSNWYFLSMCIFSLIPGVSPILPVRPGVQH